MKPFVDRIRQRWGEMTMLRLLVAIILGITLADCVAFPLWSVTVGFVVTVGAAWMWRHRAASDLYVMATAALAAMMTMNISDSQQFTSRQATRPSWAINLQHKAEQRIEQMGLRPEVEALAKGVTIGARKDITPALRQTYTRSGAAHLLAVSGLHVGFIFFMINLALGGLALMRHGPIIRSGVTIICIWTYAAMAGAAPSIVRAALMFTLLQVALSLSRGGAPLNRLAGVAALMLLWNGRWLYDAGFMLSFISVAAIVEWGIPLTWWRFRHRDEWNKAKYEADKLERLRSRWGRLQFAAQWVARSIWAAFAISIAASVATMPLVSEMFGVVTLWSIVAGPVMVWLCSIVVGATMLHIVVGRGLLTDLLGWVVEFSGSTMNAIAQGCASHDILIAEHQLSPLWSAVCYAVFILLTIVMWGTEKRR